MQNRHYGANAKTKTYYKLPWIRDNLLTAKGHQAKSATLPLPQSAHHIITSRFHMTDEYGRVRVRFRARACVFVLVLVLVL
jgi:hypothetical protein